jgi:hypothetical protein
LWPPPALIVSLPPPQASTRSSLAPVLIDQSPPSKAGMTMALAPSPSTVPEPPVATKVSLPSPERIDSPSSPEPKMTALRAVFTTSAYPLGRAVRPFWVCTNSPVVPAGSAGGGPLPCATGTTADASTPAAILAANCLAMSALA